MIDALDQALRDDLLTPPEDFAERLIAALPGRRVAARDPRWRESFFEWLALAGAVLAGMAQLIPFLFGIWTFANAG